MRGKTAVDRLAARRAESEPLVSAMRIWFETQLAKAPRAPTAEAIRYALNHRDGLERFLDDGRIELDRQYRARYSPRLSVKKELPVRRQ